MRWIDMLGQVAIFIEEPVIDPEGFVGPNIREVTVADLPACTNQTDDTPHDPGRFKLDFPGARTYLCERCYEIANESD